MSDSAGKREWVTRLLGFRFPASPGSMQPTAQDVEALRQELAALIKGIPQEAGNDAAGKTTLLKLASDANGAIKTDDGIAAADLVARLRIALETGPAAGGPIVTLWTKASDAADSQLKQLYETLRRPGHPVLTAAAERIEATLNGYRTGLTDELMDYDGSTGPARDAARQKALQTVDTYKATIAIDNHVIAAENNLFGVPVSIRATWDAALDSIKQRLTSA